MADRRWDADFVTASKLIKDGSLGRVVEFETHFDRHRPELNIKKAWKGKDIPGGGSIYDLGTHLIDQAVHLFGLPNEITGFITAQREINTENYEDSFTVLLHYDRLLVTVKSGVISPEENQLRFWIRGEKGSFKKVHYYTILCFSSHIKEIDHSPSFSTTSTLKKTNYKPV